MEHGYSGTPLAAKLGVRAGQNAWQLGMPASVRSRIQADVPGLKFADSIEPPLDFAHLFTKSRAELEQQLVLLRSALAPAGMLWVSWPKKASKVATDITEDTIRELALPLGLVDVKVCAVDETWSGLKLMIRRSLRQAPPGS
jgi:hypothetical protein